MPLPVIFRLITFDLSSDSVFTEDSKMMYLYEYFVPFFNFLILFSVSKYSPKLYISMSIFSPSFFFSFLFLFSAWPRELPKLIFSKIIYLHEYFFPSFRFQFPLFIFCIAKRVPQVHILQNYISMSILPLIFFSLFSALLRELP